MRARDLLKDFRHGADMAADEPVRAGIVSDVFGTLVRHGDLNERYYNFLLWAHARGVPVTIASTEPRRAALALANLGCDDVIGGNVKDKFDLYSGPETLEAVIDDEIVLAPALIVINPNSREFQKFLATCRYKNPERSHPAGLQHQPAP